MEKSTLLFFVLAALSSCTKFDAIDMAGTSWTYYEETGATYNPPGSILIIDFKDASSCMITAEWPLIYSVPIRYYNGTYSWEKGEIVFNIIVNGPAQFKKATLKNATELQVTFLEDGVYHWDAIFKKQ